LERGACRLNPFGFEGQGALRGEGGPGVEGGTKRQAGSPRPKSEAFMSRKGKNAYSRNPCVGVQGGSFAREEKSSRSKKFIKFYGRE